MTLVTYKGQVATCKHCHRNVHYTQKCSEYAKSLQNSVNDRLTMADVVKVLGSGGDNPFLQPKRKERTQSTRGISGIDKGLPQHRSNISLAARDISISSVEPTDHVDSSAVVVPQTQGPSAISSMEGMIGAASEEREISPSLCGFSEHPNAENGVRISNVNNNTTQQTAVNVKRAGSPLSADSKNAEKKPTRPFEVRSPRRSRSNTNKPTTKH